MFIPLRAKIRYFLTVGVSNRLMSLPARNGFIMSALLESSETSRSLVSTSITKASFKPVFIP